MSALVDRLGIARFRPAPSCRKGESRQVITPATRQDVAEARAALARIRAEQLRTVNRWPRVTAVADTMREIRERNHLAEDLYRVFGPGDRRGGG
jgi:hypothetical protein